MFDISKIGPITPMVLPGCKWVLDTTGPSEKPEESEHRINSIDFFPVIILSLFYYFVIC